nr:hypothetical protein [Oscillospiraceae bacterium]
MEKLNIISFRASDGNTVRLEHRESLPSVLSLAREYALAGYPDRYVVFAEAQTAVSVTGAALSEGETERGLYMSCILRPSIFPSQAGALGPLSAVALATALEEHSENKIGIGWISDIYCNGIRIGQSSVEGKLDDFTSYEYLIINFAVKLDPKKFPPRLTDMVRQVFEDKSVSVPLIMAKTVLNKFFAIYRELKSPQKHLNAYFTKFALTDKKIKYLEDGKKKNARVIGVDKGNLTLIIETKDGRKLNLSSASSIIIPSKI